MSRKFLQDLLKEELELFTREGAGESYRSAAEHKVHIFVVDFKRIKEEIDKELRGFTDKNNTTYEGRLGNVNEDTQIQYKRDKEAISVKARIDAMIAETLLQIRNSLNRSFNVTLQSDDRIEITVTESLTIGKYSYDYRTKQLNPATVFSLISDSFKGPRSNLKKKLTTLLNALKRQDLVEKMKKQPLLVTGHMAGSSIIERRVSESSKSIGSQVETFSAEQIRANKKEDIITEEDLKILFGDDVWKVYKNDTNDKTAFYTEIESAVFNNPRFKKIESQLRNGYIKALRKAQANLSISFADREGSDSRVTIETKKQVKNFVKTLKKDKRIKVKAINTTPKYSTGAPVVKRVKKKKPTVRKVSGKKPNFGSVGVTPPKKSDNQPQQPTLNINALKAQINARLSMTVIKNMGFPALENRTGRFARSVHVTDVTQTSKGFPSIGYTYQKYPYQTFEPGYKQGSAQRDPRVLIDRSIREIATQLIVGRFYTRRA